MSGDDEPVSSYLPIPIAVTQDVNGQDGHRLVGFTKNHKIVLDVMTQASCLGTKSIYIAGPMRGYERYNFPEFDKWACVLKENGWFVVSPAEIDRQCGFDEHTDNPDKAYIQKAFCRDCMLIANCDAIFMLHGWEQSTLAPLELKIAEACGLHVIYEDFVQV